MRKVISLIQYTLILFLALSFITCETTYIPVDSSGEIDYIQGTTHGTVILKILDAHLNTPIKNARITIAGGDSALSDSSGTVTFDSVKVGTYIVYGSRQGFESIVTGLEISIDENSNTVPVVKQSADMLYMSEKGVALNGTVYYQKESIKYLANGAKVECRLAKSGITYLEPIRSTFTLNGSYSLTNLPAYTTYNISILPFNDGEFTYKQVGTTTLTGQAVSDTLPVPGIVLQQVPDENFVVLSHNLEELEVGDSITIVFSESVDTSEINPDSIYVTIGAAQKILLRRFWRSNATSLLLTPFDGQWSLTESYRLTLKKLESVSGKVLDNAGFRPYLFSPLLSGTLGNVQGLRYRVGASDTVKVDYNTSSLYLIWSPLANAAVYELYHKASADSSWRFINSVSDTDALVSTTGEFTDGKQVKYLALGRNSTSISPLETAIILTVKDERPPYIYYRSSVSGFNNTLPVADTVRITVPSSRIPEPMDTLKSPAVILKEASYYSGTTMYGDSTYKVPENNCSWTWSTNRSGYLDVIVEANTNGAYDTLKIDFSPVTDIAGNSADTTYDGGFINYSTRN